MRSDRKQSEEGNSESEEETELFPRHAANNLKHAIELLAEHYDPNAHAAQLTNCCYRCHHPQITQAYNAFRQKVHPDLPEPSISSHYTNAQFVDLQKLTRSGSESTLTIPEPCIQPPPKTLAHLLDQLFEIYGYIPNLERFLLFYPSYLEKHRAVEKDLFQSGKTDPKSAYFMALCAAAQLGSVYMMARLLRRYLRSGGSTSWFTEEKVPPKLNALRRLNRLLAREPWEITPQVLEELLENEQLHWTRSELARYVQIMSFAHMDATVALSMGLLPEEQSSLHELNMLEILKLKANYDSAVYEPSSEGREKMAVMIPVLRQLDEEEGEKVSEFMEQLGQSNKVIKRTERKIETAENYMKEINNELNKQELYRQINHLVRPLLPPFEIIQKRRQKNNVLDYSEYNYKFMAYPILNSLTQDTADKIEALIGYAEIMTRGNFGSQKMNHTKEFRKAVRYYAQNLCGYTHHEYDFKSNVGSFLTMALKFYIRLVVMSPLHISPQVIRETNHENGTIECFDLGHLAVLLANTKMSLQLTLAVQAFEL